MTHARQAAQAQPDAGSAPGEASLASPARPSDSPGALRAVGEQRRVRGGVVVPAAASLLRFPEEGPRRATLQARGLAIQMGLVGVAGFDGESTDLAARALAGPCESEEPLKPQDAMQR